MSSAERSARSIRAGTDHRVGPATRSMQMAFKEFGNYDAVGLAELVRKKEVTATELLDEAIARTAKVDPEINAVVVKHYDYAEQQIANGLPDGPFAGVPFLLK